MIAVMEYDKRVPVTARRRHAHSIIMQMFDVGLQWTQGI